MQAANNALIAQLRYLNLDLNSFKNELEALDVKRKNLTDKILNLECDIKDMHSALAVLKAGVTTDGN